MKHSIRRLHTGQEWEPKGIEATVEGEQVIRVRVLSVRRHLKPRGTLFLAICKGLDVPHRNYRIYIPEGVRVVGAGEVLELKQNKENDLWKYWG